MVKKLLMKSGAIGYNSNGDYFQIGEINIDIMFYL